MSTNIWVSKLKNSNNSWIGSGKKQIDPSKKHFDISKKWIDWNRIKGECWVKLTSISCLKWRVKWKGIKWNKWIIKWMSCMGRLITIKIAVRIWVFCWEKLKIRIEAIKDKWKISKISLNQSEAKKIENLMICCLTKISKFENGIKNWI